jgi:L-cystine transport system substrate-binding protein
MKKFSKPFALALSAILVLSIGLTGCGNSSSDSDDDVQQIVVGTGNEYAPYCYLDDNGNLAGYEYEVLKAVDELLPQYEFTYQTSDFNNVAISLDAGKIDIAAHQYEYNEERASKYLFGTEAYTTYVTYLVVPSTDTSIHSLDDLQGKTVFTGSKGSNSTYIVENYNDEHKDNPVKIENADSVTSEEYVQSLLSGKWDAGIITKRDVDKDNEAYGSEAIKVTGDPIQTSSTYFMFAKGNTELQEAVDGALKQLKENGKLAEISIAVIGGDYTESE